MHVRRPPVTGRKVRFALVGCGRIAANHFESVKAHAERCEHLVATRAAIKPDAMPARKLAEKLGLNE